MARKYGDSKGSLILTAIAVILLGTGLLYLMNPGLFASFLGPGVVDIDQVNPQGYVYEDGGAHAAVASAAVYAYDANNNFVETATTSAAGLYTLSARFEGESIKLQVRQAAPATADPYMGPLETRIVPEGDQADTVTMLAIYVWDATETGPTQVFSDQSFNVLTAASGLNTTDSEFKVSLSAIDSDTAWGGYDTRDYSTTAQDQWIGAILVWRGGASQTWSTQPDFSVSDPDYVYYVWKIPRLTDSSADTSDDTMTFTVQAASGFVLDATVLLDCYDSLKLDANGQFQPGNLADGPGGAPSSAVTTKVV